MTASGKKILKFKAKQQATTTSTPAPTTTTPRPTTLITKNATNTTTSKWNATVAPPTAQRFWIQSPVYPPGSSSKDSRPKVSKLNKANDSIEFEVTQAMVPSCRLLVFYVRKDGETVADSMVVDVEDKLENQVSRLDYSRCNHF